jgi:hypothetical protein
MSRLRRFSHLEGKRPERSVGLPPENVFGEAPAPRPATPPQARDLVVERVSGAQEATLACASCGDVLVDGAACARCSAPADFLGGAPAPASSRADRFRNLAGNGSIPLGREVQQRTPENDIAATVPAWRGEALPPEIAADVRRKLGIPEHQEVQREDLLGWAQRQLEKPGTRNLLLLLGAGYFGRRLIGNLIGLVAGFMILVFFLVFRACA